MLWGGSLPSSSLSLLITASRSILKSLDWWTDIIWKNGSNSNLLLDFEIEYCLIGFSKECSCHQGLYMYWPRSQTYRTTSYIVFVHGYMFKTCPFPRDVFISNVRKPFSFIALKYYFSKLVNLFHVIISNPIKQIYVQTLFQT